MKKLGLLIGTLTLIFALSTNINARSLMYKSFQEDSINIWTSAKLFEVANDWANTFEKKNPETTINITVVAEQEDVVIIKNSESLGLVTNLPKDPNIWKITIGREILVPVMNSDNPFADQLLQNGISPQEFAKIYHGKLQTWGELLETNESALINLYHSNNEVNKPLLAEFLNTDIGSLNKTNINNLDQLLDKVMTNKYSISFCKLSDIINTENRCLKAGLDFIPIDKNGNNQIDFAEDVYSKITDLERSAWIGKYPKALYTNLWVIADNQPVQNEQIQFIDWLISEGQQELLNNGYSALISNEQQSNIQGLYDQPATIKESKEDKKSFAIGLIILIVTMVVLIPLILFASWKSPKSISISERKDNPVVLTEETFLAPNGIFFDKSHTWVFMEKDGSVRVGITDFLQHVTGKITNIAMKHSGASIKKGEPFITLIQEGKHLSIPSPISGKIKAVNTVLSENSSTINSSPFDNGWIYLVESANWLSEIKSYFIGKSYRDWLSEELNRLKNFFSASLKMDIANNSEVVLQDGGELNDNPLENLSPIFWEEFQSNFINRKKF